MPELWPQEFRTAVEGVFAGRLNNTTYDVVNRRVDHAFKVWRRRYSMTPQQEAYAWELLTWAVRTVAANQQRLKPRNPYIYWRRAVAASMERVVNDPNGHEGFKRRSGMVDVSEQLAGLVA